MKTLKRYKVEAHREKKDAASSSMTSQEILTAATAEAKTDAIRKCIVSGLFPNAAYLHMSGFYRTVRGDIPLAIHPTSVLYTMDGTLPPWVIFTELVHTNKIHMKDIKHCIYVIFVRYYQFTLSQNESKEIINGRQ